MNVSHCYFFICFFFFKQKTAYDMRISDWSSDVCSSDLLVVRPVDVDPVDSGDQEQLDARQPLLEPRRQLLRLRRCRVARQTDQGRVTRPDHRQLDLVDRKSVV